MESVRSCDRLRSAVACGVLRRRLLVLCWTFRIDDEFGFAVRADLCQRDGNSDHDHCRLLHLLVEEAGQTPSQGACGQGGLIDAAWSLIVRLRAAGFGSQQS